MDTLFKNFCSFWNNFGREKCSPCIHRPSKYCFRDCPLPRKSALTAGRTGGGTHLAFPAVYKFQSYFLLSLSRLAACRAQFMVQETLSPSTGLYRESHNWHGSWSLGSRWCSAILTIVIHCKASKILVNSEFTAAVFARTFKDLYIRGTRPSVLYPAVESRQVRVYVFVTLALFY